MKKCFFWGATGQAKVLNEFIENFGYKLNWLFDNNSKMKNVSVDGIKVLGGWKTFEDWTKKNNKDVGYLVAIGGETRGKERLELQNRISKYGFKLLTVWHPTSYISKSARVGKGSQILAGSILCAHVTVGDACIINTGAQVDHDSVVKDGVHIMPGAVVTGCVIIEKFATIGSKSVILPRICIGEGAIVGAGAVVTKDVKPYTVVVGNPAKVLKKLNY